jgi:23S rRNA (guanine745-N1)-methyltransferase
VLAAVAPYLACPQCAGPVRLDGRVLRCGSGHAFDLARQGYVTLLPPGGGPVPAGDTAPMLAARERFLAGGHFAGLAERVAAAAAAAAGADGCLVEIGAGTGHYLAAALDAVPGRLGIALDASKYAARRLARAHPRAGAVVCDAWRRLPLRDGAAAAVLDVFAPRNGAELRRILAPDGALIVVTPTPAHLAELVAAVGLLTVDEHKPDRLASALAPHLEQVSEVGHDWRLSLTREEVRALAEMGPSAHHLSSHDLETRLAVLAEPVAVTAAVRLSVYRRTDRDAGPPAGRIARHAE